MQDATSSGAAANALRMYTSGSSNLINFNGGNTSANSKLTLNHLTAGNAWSEIEFKRGGAYPGSSIIRSDGYGYFQLYPDSTGNVRFQINNSAATFQTIVQPFSDSTYDIGTNTNRWRNIYGDTLYGDGSNLTGISLSSSRTSANATTGSIANNASANITIAAAKTYALLKIQTSAAAWVTLYTDSTSRSNDSSRNETTDPTPGSGVIAEVITTGAATQIMTPGLIGWNNDGTVSTNVYAKVVNKSGSTGTITVTLHYVTIES